MIEGGVEYDASNGNIIIDGKSIYDSKIESLRSNISLVSQDITLFDNTIKNNIKYINCYILDFINWQYLNSIKYTYYKYIYN